MIKKGMTVKEAAELWVSQFNRFPQDMIQKLMECDVGSWREVTLPATGDKVYVFDLPDNDIEGNEIDATEPTGQIIEYLKDEGMCLIELDDGPEILVEDGDFEVERYSRLPMWGYLWRFEDSADDYWMEELDGIQVMSDCGFRIYQSDDWGYFFGIDGCGYDFYESHWIPAYRKRGLKWHDESAEKREE